MDILTILQIIQIATGIGQSLADGTHVQGDLATIAALEDLVTRVIAAHQSEVGQPMDLSKFQHIDPIV